MEKQCRHAPREPCLFALTRNYSRKGVRTLPGKVAKAYGITDAKILFVSLVDKAANQRQFLVTKAAAGKADFRTFGRIVKADSAAHYVTGIVYEPMVEDSQGNYMTAEEIEKAAHWFMKNAGDADIQHCFEKAEGVEVVESYVAKCDMEIEGQPIKKGTWLMTMEVADDDVWDKIEKGEITGFSMGGTGVYSDTDVDISDPENPVAKAGDTPEVRGLKQRIAKVLGFDVVAKGRVKDNYKRNSVRDNFWTAFYALSDYLLDYYNPETGKWEIQTDESVIRDALADFNDIVTGLLTSTEPITKALNALPVEKSEESKKQLHSIHEKLGEYLEKSEEQEEIEVTRTEIENIVAEAITKAFAAQNGQNPPAEGAGEGKPTGAVEKGNSATDGAQTLTQEALDQMVAEAVQKAMQPKETPVSPEQMQEAIEAAVEKAMEPVLRSAGLPSNLNDTVQKGVPEEEHYMHGFFD